MVINWFLLSGYCLGAVSATMYAAEKKGWASVGWWLVGAGMLINAIKWGVVIFA